MKFRTEIRIRPFAEKIGYRNRILLLGSCFADEMREKLRGLKFRASGNFSGPLFNPSSVAAALRGTADTHPAAIEELRQDTDGRWFHYGVCTEADSPDPQALLAYLDRTREALRREAEACDTLVVTFGTAWVYRLRETGETVANCHRQPQRLFERRRLSVGEIVGEWSELLRTRLRDKRVILTVSPVRHAGDGLDGNCLSKSTLRVAAAELEERFTRVDYFPAYEILTDDLRDYRFYADDLVHPSRQAVEYVWEKFAEAALDDRTRTLVREAEEIAAVLNHRPFHPDSDAYRTLCERTLGRMRRLSAAEGMDFSEEIARLEAILSA